MFEIKINRTRTVWLTITPDNVRFGYIFPIGNVFSVEIFEDIFGSFPNIVWLLTLFAIILLGDDNFGAGNFEGKTFGGASVLFLLSPFVSSIVNVLVVVVVVNSFGAELFAMVVLMVVPSSPFLDVVNTAGVGVVVVGVVLIIIILAVSSSSFDVTVVIVESFFRLLLFVHITERA